MDTDVLVMRPVEDIWNHFSMFDSVQLASMSPESEETALSWYPRFARHPFYGPNGMNSGVMLMNLTRMREFGWTEKVLEIHRNYKLKITWGDQDIVNILFHDHPGMWCCTLTLSLLSEKISIRIQPNSTRSKYSFFYKKNLQNNRVKHSGKLKLVIR